jgi:hypothetical protein
MKLELDKYEMNVLKTILTTYMVYNKRFKYKFSGEDSQLKFVCAVHDIIKRLK